ncbi:tigger transposable element-derived protein 4-like [Ruditapes philippinarum]|uniref:tigger transposable element-derived protein 4-like n=1 Tax=Ruditapes philippinarum TaxID=129788 RepID=UPI00295C29B8|nr:tigger transposable element-derived protein 4-like [Ruditapes philippinarum]
MPIEYDANKKAWVTSEIFTNWVKKFDRRISAQSRRVLLIVDNCPAHPDITGLRSVKLIFLPPNTTSVTQPMDQGVIKNLTKKQVIQRQLRAIEKGGETSISVLDALYMLKTAWHAVSPQTIANCFRHAGFQQSSVSGIEMIEDDPEDDLPLSTLRRLTSGVSFEQYTSADDSVPVCADLNDEEIINNVVSQRQSHDETLPDDNDDDELPSRSGVTICDAMDGLDAVRDFLHQQGIGSYAETERAIAKLSDISSMFSRYYLRRSECKQTSISDFFVNVNDNRL